MIKRKNTLAYDRSNDNAKFREQYRFAFSIAVITTAFVMPDENVIEQLLKVMLYISALLAALYLITSAARVKYNKPGRLYQIFYAGERFRMRLFDWSIDVFGAAFLYFIASLVTNQINTIYRLDVKSISFWIMFVAIMLIIGLLILLITYLVTKRAPSQSKKDLPKI